MGKEWRFKREFWKEQMKFFVGEIEIPDVREKS